MRLLLETEAGASFDLLMTYMTPHKEFPRAMLEETARQKRLVMLTMQSWVPVLA